MITKRKSLILLASLLLCLLLVGCASDKAEPESAAEPEVSAAPEATAKPSPTPEPRFNLLGTEYAAKAESVDLSSLSDDSAAECAAVLAAMPNVKSIYIGSELDTPLSWDSISLIHEAAPKAAIDYGFTLYDKQFNLSDESMDIKWIQIDDEGALVEQITACMVNLTYLDMDSCGVSNERMAQIRDGLPNAEVVWRIWFGDYYTARTNVEKILASMPGKGGELIHDNVMDLKYCTKVKYLDLGHNNHLDTIEFIRYMPDLEVLITGMTFVEDYSPVADCPKLEYVEAMTSRLHDLTPFAELKNLRHLNICYNFSVNDISPLYGLTELERLYIGWHCPVDPAQVAEMQKAAPNCLINNTTKDPTDEEWRYAFGGHHPRYDLLRQQFGYEEWDFAYIWNDPLYYYGW